MKRQPQVLLIAATLACSWLAMQAVHELGHVAAATVSGGRVKSVVLHPAAISYAEYSSNPHPLLVSWMGPIVGVVLPLVALAIARWFRWRTSYLFRSAENTLWEASLRPNPSTIPQRHRRRRRLPQIGDNFFNRVYLFQFFAGFCLIANGAYLAFGSIHGIGDAGDIARHGSPLWLLWLFGVITIPLGLLMWNQLGPHFGLGANAGQVERTDAYTMCALLAMVVLIEILLSPTAGRV